MRAVRIRKEVGLAIGALPGPSILCRWVILRSRYLRKAASVKFVGGGRQRDQGEVGAITLHEVY